MKIYDLSKPIAKALEIEYPIFVFSLGLQMHMAPRALKAYDCYMFPDNPSNSIIAGCL